MWPQNNENQKNKTTQNKTKQKKTTDAYQFKWTQTKAPLELDLKMVIK